jgi:P27 family predicted phage terminase small subunit
MRGRKPKPNALKLIAGNPGKRPVSTEPDAPGDLFAAPASMTDAQKAIWRHAIDNAPKGLLRHLDRELLTEWVRAIAELNAADLELQQSGPVVKQGGGERITTKPDGSTVKTVRSESWVVSPWAKARDNAFQRMLKATSELGFSPTSRSRITLAGAGASKPSNRFANNAAKKRA